MLSFFKNKKVFLTGHTGFKGCWLMLWLKSLGAEVTGYALPAEKLSLYSLIDGDHFCTSITGDLADEKRFTGALHASNADIIFHLAAQSLVRKSYADPVETYRTNIMGSVTLLEAARTAKHTPKAVINVTSDKCYRNDGSGTPFKEDDALGGLDPYSSSKAAAEIVTEAYRHSFFDKSGIPLASARAGNVIGGGDFAQDRIIPDIIAAIKRDAPVIIRSPNAVRPWQHVLDALHGYMLLAMRLSENPAFAKGYNFGPAEEKIPVQALAERLIAGIGRGRYEIDPARANLYEAPMLMLDAGLAREELGWNPVFNAAEAIAFTADWYKNYLNNPDGVYDATLGQINHFMRKCS